jgi:hypothetical protein
MMNFTSKLQKRQTPEKGFALIGKRYHNQLKRCQNDGYIADIKSVHNKKAEPNDPALSTLKASFVSRHHPIRLSHHSD